MNEFMTKLEDFGLTTEAMGEIAMNLLGGIGIIIVGWMIAAWFKRLVTKALNRRESMDPTLKPLLASIGQYVIMIATLVAALAMFGIPTASVLAVLGAAGLAIGLALQGTLSNIAAGVMLLMLRPLRVGEFIETPDVTGSVVEVGLFSTELKTIDGLFLSVPNSKLWGNQILNYDRYPVRRLNVYVGVAYATDLEHAQQVLIDAMQAHEKSLEEPGPPEVLIDSFADSSINLRARCWIKADGAPLTATSMRAHLKKALDAADIEIPFPQRVVHQIGGNK